MVKLFMRHRYTKKNCPESVVKWAMKLFGGFKLFRDSKVIHSACAWNNPKTNDLHQIQINENSPICKEDLWSLNFLRTYADCIVTTGKILRKEPSAFDRNLHKQLRLPTDVFFNHGKGKPLAIMTNTLLAPT